MNNLALLKASIEMAESALAVADMAAAKIDKRQNHKRWLAVWQARETVVEHLNTLYRQWYQATKDRVESGSITAHER